MIPRALSQLRFSLKSASFSTIAGTIGVPYQRVVSWARGSSAIPTIYNSSIRNIYQRASYAALREAGAMTRIARRYSSYAVQSVEIKISNIKLTAQDFTTARYSDWLIKNDITPSRDIIDEQWNKIYEDVIKGMRDSQLPEDIWEKYFGRAL